MQKEVRFSKVIHISLKFTRLLQFLLPLFLLFVVKASYALSFEIPQNSNVVGTAKTAIIQDGEDFSDIVQRYDIGYYELYEANPNVDPDNPPKDTAIIIPTQYIIPPELQENTIVINLAEMRLYYQPAGEKRVYIFPVGIGREDWNTPTGSMRIVEKIENPKWVVPDSIYKFRKQMGDPVQRVVMPGPENPLGKYKLRLSKPEYEIHGTNSPETIGRRTSSGCIRLYPNDIDKLFHMAKVGTKVIIMNKPYKVGQMDGAIYLEAHMPLFEERMKWGDDTSPAVKVVETIDKNHMANIDWQKVNQVTHEHLCIPREVGSSSDGSPHFSITHRT